MRSLTINPGSSSTKIAVYDRYELKYKTTIYHDMNVFLSLDTMLDQIPFRLQMIEDFLETSGVDLQSITGFIARGGILKPCKSGLYEINSAILSDLKTHKYGEHVANLGGLLAYELAKKANANAFIADPESVDELSDIAKFSGLNGIKRRSVFHALSQKAVAKTYAEFNQRKYEDLTLIIAHLGSGISVGLHDHGRVVDVNNSFDGEGPMSPERSGSLPALAVYEFFKEEVSNLKEMQRMITQFGGIFSYLNTQDMREVEQRIHKNKPDAKKVLDALMYQLGKEISQYFYCVDSVDAILLTGGFSNAKDLLAPLIDKLSRFAPVKIYPFEYEAKALNDYYQSYMMSDISLNEY